MANLDTWQGIASRETTGGRKAIGPPSIVNVVTAAVWSSAAVLRGIIGNREVEIILDSGSTVSPIQECIASNPATDKLLHH